MSYISTLVDYDTLSTSSQKDDWVIAIDSIDEDLSEENLRLCVFLLVRAFSEKSDCPSFLIVKAFEPVHKALMASRLPDEDWSLLEKELPWVSLFRKWDKANRLMLGVVGKFIAKDLPVDDF